MRENKKDRVWGKYVHAMDRAHSGLKPRRRKYWLRVAERWWSRFSALSDWSDFDDVFWRGVDSGVRDTTVLIVAGRNSFSQECGEDYRQKILDKMTSKSPVTQYIITPLRCHSEQSDGQTRETREATDE